MRFAFFSKTPANASACRTPKFARPPLHAKHSCLRPFKISSLLPEARDLASSALQQSSLQSLYGTKNAQTTVESYLCPDVGDGTLVSPEVFGHELEALLEKLRGSDNPKVRAMLEDVIVPLLENGQLLSAYRGLMIGG